MTPGTKLIYHGPTGGALLHGDYVTVVEFLPHGTHYDTAPWKTYAAEFLADKNRVIGDWILVREDYSDSLALLPVRWFHRWKVA